MKRDATPVLARDLMLLSARLQKASGGWRTLLEDGYWHLMYLCTRMLEKAG